jgi:hypothetical protein
MLCVGSTRVQQRRIVLEFRLRAERAPVPHTQLEHARRQPVPQSKKCDGDERQRAKDRGADDECVADEVATQHTPRGTLVRRLVVVHAAPLLTQPAERARDAVRTYGAQVAATTACRVVAVADAGVGTATHVDRIGGSAPVAGHECEVVPSRPRLVAHNAHDAWLAVRRTVSERVTSVEARIAHAGARAGRGAHAERR